MENRRRWHKASIFGDGPRVPMCRERRAVWKARLNMHRRAKRITPLHEDIGLALSRRLSVDGRLDPSHDTLADDVGCSVRSVQRALERFKALGLVMWANRIVRRGRCVDQTSNAYALALGDTSAFPTGGQRGRGITKRESPFLYRPLIEATPEERKAARQALADRATVVAARLADKGRRARGPALGLNV